MSQSTSSFRRAIGAGIALVLAMVAAALLFMLLWTIAPAPVAA